jgi:hypothetical protein
MFYLKLVLLVVGLVAIGVVNYRSICRTANKLVELYKNG